jgi:hypothetical protein
MLDTVCLTLKSLTHRAIGHSVTILQTKIDKKNTFIENLQIQEGHIY